VTCKLCKEYREKYPVNAAGVHDLGDNCFSGPVECAFEYGSEFSTDNWNCQTMTALRELPDPRDSNADGVGALLWHSDGNYALLPIPNPWPPPALQAGVLVMSWYKRRGRTGRALVFCDDESPQVLRLETAEFLLEQYKEQTCDSSEQSSPDTSGPASS
jgi:hypothetical protein